MGKHLAFGTNNIFLKNMKVLWFTTTPSLYDLDTHYYHGCGWISSLERLISLKGDIELGVSFYHKTDSKKVIKNDTSYYPIKIKRQRNNPIKAIIGNWIGTIDHLNLENKYLEVIHDFKPDIIHVFGTENAYTEICQITNIPVVVHMQGLINPIVNAYYPVNQSKLSFLMSPKLIFDALFGTSQNFIFKKFRNIAKQEVKYFRHTHYILGRTHWDKMLAKLYNPEIHYFHIDEVLRPEFYEAVVISHKKESYKFQIISTLSPTIYKGIDLVLKTAKQLRQLSNIDFQWQIVGLEENDKLLKHFEKTEGINHKDVGVACCGKKGPSEIIELLQKSDVYVHPSYIDNSPNSLCEAQMLGLPVIACNVGGVSTLIRHQVDGFLIPSNGVFELVHFLKLLQGNIELALEIGHEARKIAMQRHNPDKIVAEILNVYNAINY
jgi:glycosyltransferase involved in cell wall biosynthesis